jgi:hypothetical protein
MFKIFEIRRGAPTFLYHRLAGRREIPLDTWLAAEVKWAKEGSSPYYWTAFHVYPSLAAVAAWRHRTRRTADRVVVEVTVRQVTKKPTRGEAYLAREMVVTRDQWAARRPLAEIGNPAHP